MAGWDDDMSWTDEPKPKRDFIRPRWEDQHPRFQPEWNDNNGKPKLKYVTVRRWHWQRIILWAALYLALIIGAVKAWQQW